MKLKVEFCAEELEMLNGENSFAEVVDMAHNMLDEAIANRNENIKCAITVDSTKD